jgi:NADPH:quinone reductase-like Zn-dependent oxidoreductase
MKGTVFEKQGAAPVVVGSLEKPRPGPDQVLVKSLWAAINPV